MGIAPIAVCVAHRPLARAAGLVVLPSQHRCCESPWARRSAASGDSSSRPLESNQNLSGFNRARRPATPERDTSAARGFAGDAQRRSSSSSSSVVREPPSGRRAHLGRRRARSPRERTYRDSRSVVRSRVAKSSCRSATPGDRRPENVEGPLGLPGRPFRHWTWDARQVRGGPPQGPVSPTRR